MEFTALANLKVKKKNEKETSFVWELKKPQWNTKVTGIPIVILLGKAMNTFTSSDMG